MKGRGDRGNFKAQPERWGETGQADNVFAPGFAAKRLRYGKVDPDCPRPLFRLSCQAATSAGRQKNGSWAIRGVCIFGRRCCEMPSVGGSCVNIFILEFGRG